MVQAMTKANTPSLAELALIDKTRETLGEALPESPFLNDDAPYGTLAAPRGFDGENVGPFLDLTNLKPQATVGDITSLCQEAAAQKAAAVCVNPCRVALAAKTLKKSQVKPICVVGFPLGSGLAEATAYEAKQAIKAGAREVDMVQNVAFIKEGHFLEAYNHIKTVTDAAGKVPVKVILETCKLTDEEIVASSLIAACAGAAFVKTSTGFALDKLEQHPHTGATTAAVRLMRLAVGSDVGVKASGGIKTPEDAKTLLENGASRLGASGLKDASY